MIELKLLKECNDCPEFEVHQDSRRAILMNGEKLSQHIVTCEHIDKCKNLIKLLEKAVNGNGQ